MNNPNIIIAGGGTGGHLFPAIAIGEEIRNKMPDANIHYIGSVYGLESRVFPIKDLVHTLLPIKGLQRGFSMKGLLKNFILPFRIISSILKVRSLYKDIKPSLIIGTGGYASAIPLFVASRLNPKIPILLQEQNSYPGLTTRMFANKAQKIFVAFSYDNFIFKQKTELTGNPIRNNINSGNKNKAYKDLQLNKNKNTLFIFGGSQGSSFLNKSIESIINNLKNSNTQILWQTGTNEFLKYKKYNNETTKVVSFINDMANAYSIADLIVCRSGAITLSEITTCGKPSILIPFAAAAENHQLKNAKTLLDAGASSLIEEKDLISNILYKKINSLLNDKERLQKMSLAARRLSKPNAATNIAKLSLEIGFNV